MKYILLLMLLTGCGERSNNYIVDTCYIKCLKRQFKVEVTIIPLKGYNFECLCGDEK